MPIFDSFFSNIGNKITDINKEEKSLSELANQSTIEVLHGYFLDQAQVDIAYVISSDEYRFSIITSSEIETAENAAPLNAKLKEKEEIQSVNIAPKKLSYNINQQIIGIFNGQKIKVNELKGKKIGFEAQQIINKVETEFLWQCSRILDIGLGSYMSISYCHFLDDFEIIPLDMYNTKPKHQNKILIFEHLKT